MVVLKKAEYLFFIICVLIAIIENGLADIENGWHRIDAEEVDSMLSQAEQFGADECSMDNLKDQDCIPSDSSCVFYECVEQLDNTRCGANGYFIGYGKKYCEKFLNSTRPKLQEDGKKWLDKTLICLQKAISGNLHLRNNYPSAEVCHYFHRLAFDSHPRCYVDSGLCELLSPTQWYEISRTVDVKDIVLNGEGSLSSDGSKQIVATVTKCALKYIP